MKCVFNPILAFTSALALIGMPAAAEDPAEVEVVVGRSDVGNDWAIDMPDIPQWKCEVSG